MTKGETKFNIAIMALLLAYEHCITHEALNTPTYDSSSLFKIPRVACPSKNVIENILQEQSSKMFSSASPICQV